jgi:hypothetical protein
VPIGEPSGITAAQPTWVGQQGALVGHDLQLDQVGLQRLAGQPGGEHGLGRGAAARRVGQHLDVEPAEQVQHSCSARRVDPAHRHRRQRRPGRHQRALQDLQVRGTSGAHDQP